MNKQPYRLYLWEFCRRHFSQDKNIEGNFDKIVILNYINAAQENINKQPINWGRKMTLFKLELVEETGKEEGASISTAKAGETGEKNSGTENNEKSTEEKEEKAKNNDEARSNKAGEKEKGKSFLASILSSLVDRLSKMAAKAAIEDVNISTYVGLFLNRVEKKLEEMLENGEQIIAPISAVYSWGAGKAEDVGGIALAITPREKCNRVGEGDASGINIYEGLIGINLRNLAEFLMHSPKNRAFLLATVAIIDDLVDFGFPNVLMWKIEGCVPNEKNLELNSTYDFHGYSIKSFRKASNKIKEVTFEELQEKINDFKEHMKEKGKEKYELTDYRYREKVLVTISKKKAADIFLRTITSAIELIANALQKKIEDINKKFNEHDKVIKMVVQLKTEAETEEETTKKIAGEKQENNGGKTEVVTAEFSDKETEKEIEQLRQARKKLKFESKSLDYKLDKIFLVEEVAKFNLQTLILESFNDTSWESLRVSLSKTNLTNLKII
jgi:hypothetical protein